MGIGGLNRTVVVGSGLRCRARGRSMGRRRADQVARAGRGRDRRPRSVRDHRARRAPGALERGDRARHRALRIAAAGRARHLDRSSRTAAAAAAATSSRRGRKRGARVGEGTHRDVGLRPARVRAARRAALAPRHGPGQPGPGRPPARDGARAHGLLARQGRRPLRRRDRLRGRRWYERAAGRRSARPTPSSTSCAPRARPPPRRATPSCRAGSSPKGARAGRHRAGPDRPPDRARRRRSPREHDLSSQARAVSLALANERRDNALAAADVAAKRAALNKARDALDRGAAQPRRGSAGHLSFGARGAPGRRARGRRRRRGRAGGPERVDRIGAAPRARPAATRSRRRAPTRTRAQQGAAERAPPGRCLPSRRLRVLQHPGRHLAPAARHPGRRQGGTQHRSATSRGSRARSASRCPADEVLFFTTLPLRVDSVRVRRGDTVTGRVMTVSNSRLAIDSSLSINDAKLVRPGATVEIEEPDLGIKTTGVVTQVADAPGHAQGRAGPRLPGDHAAHRARAAGRRLGEAHDRGQEHPAGGARPSRSPRCRSAPTAARACRCSAAAGAAST